MRVHLADLKPNPMRDFSVDPIDDDAVKALTASIKENDFWGGVTARKCKDGTLQIACGHHRIKAAIKAGLSEADVYVSRDWDDAKMLRVYAEENATQRGSTSTAVAGSVAAALKFLAKHGGGSSAGNPADGSYAARNGIGWSQIVDFLDGIPGVNKNTVIEQLANLKSSGDYERILKDAQAEIEKENKAALAELKRQEAEAARRQKEAEEAEQRQKEAEERRKAAQAEAKKAKEEADRKRAQADAQRAELEREKQKKLAEAAVARKAEADKELEKFAALKTKRDVAAKLVEKAEAETEKKGGVTFDFEGVARHLKVTSHVSTFRELALAEGNRAFLPVNKQAVFAKHLVDLARSEAKNGELNSSFIRDRFYSALHNVKTEQKRINADEKAELTRRDWEQKAKDFEEYAARAARSFLLNATKRAQHERTRPKTAKHLVSGEFKNAVSDLRAALDALKKAGLV